MNVEEFFRYLQANNSEAYLELERYYHLVEIISFDVQFNNRTKEMRVHNVFYLAPKRCLENGKYIGAIKK